MKIEPGAMVKILECHKMPDLVGKTAKVLSVGDPAVIKHPILVMLPEPIEIKMETSIGTATIQVAGPFPFREDELEPVQADAGIPDDILKAFDDGKLEDGKDG